MQDRDIAIAPAGPHVPVQVVAGSLEIRVERAARARVGPVAGDARFAFVDALGTPLEAVRTSHGVRWRRAWWELDAERAVELEPDDVDSRIFLGRLHRIRRDAEGAERALLGEDGKPVSPAASLLLYQVYLEQDRLEEALALVNALIAEEPDDLGAYMAAATVYERMDDLGLPFEHYDDVGTFRTEELGKPVIASGLVESGVAEVDGAYSDPFEMLATLAESRHVQRVFVRHAFRFWMGRNETPDDAPTLIAADEAYEKSGGSMKALVRALLTSDSFLYRYAPGVVTAER